MAEPIRVLVVDDEPLAIERLQLLLARIEGVALAGTALAGEAALRLVEATEPDAILLDIAMPGMDGIDVARALARVAKPPVVISRPWNNRSKLLAAPLEPRGAV